MRIAVLGHLCFDTIKHADGKESKSYGGIFYTVGALANLLSENDLVVPVFGVGKSQYEQVNSLLDRFGNVDTSGIYRMNGQTNRVTLTYGREGSRVECSRHISEAIPMKKIRPALSSDLIIINMISGFDITLDVLDEIRILVREDQKPVYLDVHCLVCGVNPDFTRFYRPVDTWRRWFFMLHGVQMNEQEAASVTYEVSDEINLARQILSLNTKVLHITRGDRGSTVFVNENKQIQQHEIAPVEPDKAVDTTGCGDVYAAAYCAYYLRSKEIIKAAAFANEVASFNAQFPGSEGIDALSRFRERLA